MADMNFYETINFLGYEIKEKTKEKIIICRKTNEAILYIVFHNNKKCIHGLLEPDRYITNEVQFKKLAKRFEELQNVVNKLAQLSGYDKI